MAGGLGGLGGFGSVLGALGQSLLTSPRENPFQGLPAALQASAKDREHQAALSAMSTVAEKLGIPKELAASPEAMKLFIDHINATKLTQLRQQAAQGISLTPPDEGGAASQPALSVPGAQSSSSGIPTTFNVAGGPGGGGLDGPGGLGGPTPSFAEGAGRSGRPLTLRQGALSGSAAEKGRAVFNGLVARGLSPLAAASVTGNIRGESAFNTSAIGDQGTSGGLAQWHNERWSALKQRAAQQGKPWTDLDVQLDHLVSELKGPYKGTLTAISSAQNPQEGALAFMRGFERPSAKAMAQSGPLRASAAASAFNLYGGSGNQVASAAPAGQATDAAPLPPPRPTQLASNDPNMPLPSTAMQRVMDEARAKGIGQGGPDIGPDSGPGIGQGGYRPWSGPPPESGLGGYRPWSGSTEIGQSGAPLNQVAAGGRRMTVPIPGALSVPSPGALTPGENSLVPPRPPYTGSAPATPAPVTAPAAPPPVSPPPATPPAGEGTNKTKAWAKNLFQYGMNQLALSNGDPVLMKQAEIILQRAAKYGDPSDMARRVGEAGLAGTPAGRGLIAGFPSHTIEKLLEQQIPGYESPGTLEQRKFLSAEDERRWQHSRLETEFGATEEERRFRRKLDREKLANEIGHQTLQLGEQRASRKQQRDIATESHAIQLTPPAQILGRALTTDRSAAETRAGLDAQQQQAAAEAAARDRASAQVGFAKEATASAQAAEALVSPVREAQQHLETVVNLGGYGPQAPGSRTLNAIIPDIPGLKPAHAAEVARQKFDQAMARVGALRAAAVNKAQSGGNMNTTEQVLARADLAKLNSADPEVARQSFRQLNEDIDRAQALDRRFGIYKGEQQTRGREGAATPAMSQSDVAQTLSNARAAIAKNPAARNTVLERLRAAGIDPGGL